MRQAAPKYGVGGRHNRLWRTEDGVVAPLNLGQGVAHHVQIVAVGMKHMPLGIELGQRYGTVQGCHGALELGHTALVVSA